MVGNSRNKRGKSDSVVNEIDDNANAVLRKLTRSLKMLETNLVSLQNFVANFEQETGDKNAIPTRIELLNKYNVEFDKIVDEVCMVSTDEEFDGLQDSFHNLNEKFVELKSGLYSLSETFDISVNETRLVNESATKTNYKLSNLGIKTPPVQIPYFDGSFVNWITFRDTYSAIVHNNTGLDDVVKFTILIDKLKGDAKDSMGHINVTSEGYHKVWNALLAKYNNNPLIIDRHIDALLKLPCCYTESAHDLKKLINQCTSNISALEALGQKVDELSEIILVNIVREKLDPTTRKEWENAVSINEIPKWDQLVKFLEKRSYILESIESYKKPNPLFEKPKQTPTSKFQKSVNSINKSRAFVSVDNSCNKNTGITCYNCKESHPIFQCESLLKLSIFDRYKLIKQLNACINCLRNNHTLRSCKAQNSCKKCNGKHCTLLHFSDSDKKSFNESQSNNSKQFEMTPNTSNKDEASSSQVSLSVQLGRTSNKKQTLLSTAVILIADNTGVYHTCRALLDSASQSHFITTKLANKLGCLVEKTNIAVSCLDNKHTNSTLKTTTSIKSRINSYKETVDCLIVSTILDTLPSHNINISKWDIPANIELADPNFNKISEVDLLIGHGTYLRILKPAKFLIKENLPFLLDTEFGWILGGDFIEPIHSFISLANDNVTMERDKDKDLNNRLERFWELENYPIKKFLSNEEQACENNFIQTHQRDESGRYVVDLPFKNNYKNLGESKTQAVKRFQYLENRLNGNPELKKQYSQFITEYESLGHMKQVDEFNDKPNQINYYLPHHAVIKPSSSTTKVRVVFDASAKSDSQLSLNDVLMIGATVQDNLFSIILRFRKYRYVFTTDITKMYRQVNINPNHTSFQRIIWRSNFNKKIETYELSTVTYGTASAPFLATRALKQLALDEAHNHKEASNIALRDFYVDDLLSGSDDLEEAKFIQREIISLLTKGGFHLHKWCSNNQTLLNHIPDKDREILTNEIIHNETIKTLGLLWQPREDNFIFNVQPVSETDQITKRSVLSNIAKLYDPLGLVSPVMITAKLLIQSLWKSHIEWDEDLPELEKSIWILFRNNLTSINEIRLNRHVMPIEAQTIELHGFSDASLKAYGACIYLRCINKVGRCSSMLLCSKSRVAPLKTISIARLELCAALLLSNLITKVIESMQINFKNIFLWTDSEIVLAWIKTQPFKLKTFVANRVNEIQESTYKCTWLHIPTNINPADLISRGIMPNELSEQTIWWQGPSFLYTNTEWPEQVLTYDNILESRDNTVTFTNMSNAEFHLIDKYSSFTKLQRVTALCLRFTHNCKVKTARKTGPLSIEEINVGLSAIIKYIQKLEFQNEISCLQKSKELPNSSKLRSLNPFLDENSIIRVGGRLDNSDYEYDVKHQILLPYNNKFTQLLFRHEHIKNFHAGPQLLVSVIRQKYWPIQAKRLAKEIVHHCIICFRGKPIISQQIMGDLPKARTTPSRPFFTSGVDFCGPFLVKNKFQRNTSSYKVYACLFVCFVTKAVHIELVTEQTSEAFIACLKRFISRRGKINTLWSDNAKNFVGANRELKTLYQLFQNQEQFDKINKYLTLEQIAFKFIPPRSPNFGGLWESSIKSMKSHLKRVSSNIVLSYEELNTLVIQIEGIMNSRPLSPLSDDPNDPLPLTPGHFLTGGPINSIVEPDIHQIKSNHLSKWQRITQMTQSFWKRFSVEYIHTLQQRVKWKLNKYNLKTGDLVLVADDNITCSHWLLGIIVAVIHGPDMKVRVADVKTKNGIFRRALSKLCKLPINTNEI